MNISMNLPAFILMAALVFSFCVLLLATAFHQFCKAFNQFEEAKTWHINSDDDDDDNNYGDPADAWKRG